MWRKPEKFNSTIGNNMEIIWGLYIFTLMSGIGFDSSHSITDLEANFPTKKECVKAAQLMNSGSSDEREIGLDPGIRMRYVCLAKPRVGIAI